jgi:hypothetical protein
MYNILASSAFGTRFIKNFYLKIFVNFWFFIDMLLMILNF